LSVTVGEVVTPELALVDPELAEARRQTPERKAAMSSTEPSNGTFFVDPAQPPPAPAPEPLAAPAPLVEQPAAPSPAPPPAPAEAVAAGPGTTPMLDVPLGTLIFRAGLLAEEQLEDALQEGMRTGKRLGEVLLERGWLHERDLGRLLAGQKGLPFVEVRAADADPAALQVLPEEKARLQTTLPLRFEDGRLVVAVADPSNELVLENLRRTLGAEPRLVVAPHGELIRAIGEAYSTAAAPNSLAAPVAASVPEPQPEPQPVPGLQPEPAPVVAAPEQQPIPSLQPEPAAPAPPPAVTPMPTVLPPTEERSAEVPPLQPLMPEPVPQPVMEPAPLLPPAPPPVVEETPAPVPGPPPIQAEPTVPTEQETPPLLQPAQPPLEPTAPAAPATPVEAPVEAPPPLPEPAPAPAPEPPLVPPAAEQVVEPRVAPLLAQPEAVPAPETSVPAPTVSPELEPQPGPASIHIVLLRLRDGDVLEVGTFNTVAEASQRAQDVVRQIAEAEGAATWPFFADRYLRPDTIVSVDLLEKPADKWMGSAVRTRWATQG